MSAHYQLLFLYTDHSDVVKAVCDKIIEELQALCIGTGNLRIEHNPGADTLSNEVPTVALFIGSSSAKHNPSLIALVDRIFATNTPVVPVVVKAEKFGDVVPESLHPINALEWREPRSSSKIAAWVLRLIGLTEKQRRVFVSYRRFDALKMGEQVWEALSKAGFDVFLDRFNIDPAENFQERLTERLADKAFVLLIESPDTRSSKWVMHEVDYALKHRLGFMTLTWPETKNRDLLVESIFEGYRLHLADSALVQRDGYTMLVDEFLSSLCDEVEARHAAAMLRRRRQLLDSIIVELRRKNLPFTQLSDWTVVVERSTAGGQKHRIVSVTPRPPEIPDLYLLDRNSNDYKRAQVDGSLLVHSTCRFGRDREELLRWAIGTRSLTLRSEDQIVDLVSDLAADK
jgi:hypothetical protein